MTNRSGNTLIVFLSLIIVVLVSATSISFFLLKKETEKLGKAEKSLSFLQEEQKKLEADLTGVKKQLFIVQEKNREADEKINSLLDDLEFEEGLKAKLKEETDQLKVKLGSIEEDKKKLKDAMSKEVEVAQQKFDEAKKQLDAVVKEKDDLMAQLKSIQESKENLEGKISTLSKEKNVLETQQKIVNDYTASADKEIVEQSMLRKDRGSASTSSVNLEPIVVKTPQGRVLSIDSRTEFLIFDLGSKHGIRAGQVVSIYRGDNFLGDVKVSRVQDEMSAADFIPPFSSQKARKNDLVVTKPL